MTLQQHVLEARDRLVRAGIEPRDAALGAELLARQLLGWDRATFVCRRGEIAPADFGAGYARRIARRERREPVAYITGVREFWGLEFEVSRDVLIPRPESELIIEEAIACLLPAAASIVDAGTGSGCLAVALARQFPGARIIATDISAGALVVARRSARRHGVADRVTFVQTDYLAGVASVPDLVVCNPPYVAGPTAPALVPEVRDYEPHAALLGGPDGLDGVRELLRQADACLRPGAWLIFEFGCGQEDAVREAIARWPRFSVARIRADLQGIPRTAVVQKTGR